MISLNMPTAQTRLKPEQAILIQRTLIPWFKNLDAQDRDKFIELVYDLVAEDYYYDNFRDAIIAAKEKNGISCREGRSSDGRFELALGIAVADGGSLGEHTVGQIRGVLLISGFKLMRG